MSQKVIPELAINEANLLAWAKKRAEELNVEWKAGDTSPEYRVLLDVLGRWEWFTICQMDEDDLRSELRTIRLSGSPLKSLRELMFAEVVAELLAVFASDGPGAGCFVYSSMADLIETPPFAETYNPFEE